MQRQWASTAEHSWCSHTERSFSHRWSLSHKKDDLHLWVISFSVSFLTMGFASVLLSGCFLGMRMGCFLGMRMRLAVYRLAFLQ